MFLQLVIWLVALCLCGADVAKLRSSEVPVPISRGGHGCGENETWYDTCFCAEDCNYGTKCFEGNVCFCKPGYKRYCNRCVTKCPSDMTCPRTMILSNCHTCAVRCYPNDITVQPRCELIPATNRHLNCGQERKYCVCPPGWKWYNGECVETCPPYDCGDNGFVYNACYNHDWQKCPDPSNLNGTTVDSGNCYPGCFCPMGFFLMNGNCLRESWCPIGEHKCHPGFEYVTDGNLCARWCSAETCLACPALSFFVGCICKRGTYWDDVTNKCVTLKECLLAKAHGYCPFEHTEYTKKKQNLNKCPEVGLDLNGAPEEVLGCFCVDGYLFNKFKGKCVPKNQCPPVL